MEGEHRERKTKITILIEDDEGIKVSMTEEAEFEFSDQNVKAMCEATIDTYCVIAKRRRVGVIEPASPSYSPASPSYSPPDGEQWGENVWDQ